MSFVPKMQNYFGKDSDFSKLSNLYGDAAAFQQSANIKGDLVRDQAAKRAQMRLLAGEYAKEQGQAAGSAKVDNAFKSAIGDAVSGGLQGAFSSGGIFNQGNDPFRDPTSSDLLTNDVQLAQDWSQSGGDNFTYWDSDMDTSSSILRKF